MKAVDIYDRFYHQVGNLKRHLKNKSWSSGYVLSKITTWDIVLDVPMDYPKKYLLLANLIAKVFRARLSLNIMNHPQGGFWISLTIIGHEHDITIINNLLKNLIIWERVFRKAHRHELTKLFNRKDSPIPFNKGVASSECIKIEVQYIKREFKKLLALSKNYPAIHPKMKYIDDYIKRNRIRFYKVNYRNYENFKKGGTIKPDRKG